MTDLRRTKFEKNLFQNYKMTEEVNKTTLKQAGPEMRMINDILERITYLKRTAKELEKIALTLKRKLDKETENVIDTDKEESKTPPASDLFKCDFCSLAFKNISNLEKHIK